MIILIAIITAILYIILISFTLHNLSSVANTKVKYIYIILGLAIMLICIVIVFYLSLTGLDYKNTNIVTRIRNIMITVFTPVNGLIVMPYLANNLSKIGTNEITQEKFKKRLLILNIIFIVVLIFECSYFKNTQLGILKMISQR